MFPAIVPPQGFRCILIEDLRLQLFIGVNPEEKAARQGVSVSIYMMVRDSGPALSDALADHVSYADVVAKLRERGRSARHVNLVETLAEESAAFALAEPRVDSVIVAVRKLSIVAEAKGVGVVIHRRRGA
jgi:7,8-dihydroneopterin aldolase/epimerase/oxygenase